MSRLSDGARRGFARRITVIHRRDELRASKILQERAFAKEKINFLWSHTVEEIRGNEKEVTGVFVRNRKTGDRYGYPTQGVFIFIGFRPNNQFLPAALSCDETGRVIVDLRMRTEVPGVFAAGDIRSGSDRQLATAAGDGVTSALSAYEYLKEIEMSHKRQALRRGSKHLFFYVIET